jgi:hypothetical protein
MRATRSIVNTGPNRSHRRLRQGCPVGQYRGSVRLERTRRAMVQAERALADLEVVADDSDRFRDEFVPCIGMIQRVGSVLDEESRGHRTPAFGAFWQQTGADPLFRSMADIRNAEFKRGEDRKSARHDVHLFETVTVTRPRCVSPCAGRFR